MMLQLLNVKVQVIYLICGENNEETKIMKFFNDKEVPFSFRFDGYRNIAVKPKELSPFIDFFNLSKKNIKYIFSNFPVVFESETERNKFDKQGIPYKLHKEITKENKILVREQPEMPSIVKSEEKARFVESKKMEVEEVKMLEPTENKMGGAITSVEKSIFETKEKERLPDKQKQEDQIEDVLSGELERILEVPKRAPVKPKEHEHNVLEDALKVDVDTPRFIKNPKK